MSVESRFRQSAIVRMLDRSVAFLNAVGSLWVLLLVVLICADSFGRSLFNRPIEGVTELVAVSLAVIVFCQLPDTARLGRLTRSETMLLTLRESNTVGAALAVIGFELLGAAVMVAIIIGTWPLLVEAITRGYYIGEHGIFTLPEWPLKGLVVLGSFACLLCFLVRAAGHWLLVRDRRR